MNDFDLLLEDLKSEYEQYPYETDFVIHEHYASHRHFDLRIRRGDAAPSWALPKARLPYETNEKLLAVRTPDHPLSWMSFKGDIPHGQYGAGKVFIYDKGKCYIYKWGDVIVVDFKGTHVTGFFLLIHTNGDNWLIIRPDQEKTKNKYNNKISESMFVAYDYEPASVVAAMIHHPDHKYMYLLQDHVKFDLWTLPSGKVDIGEDPAEAMIREMKEELDIDVLTFDILVQKHIEYPLKNGEIVKTDGYLFDICRYSGTPRNMEPHKHREIKWFSLHELRQTNDITVITHWLLDYIDGVER